MNVTRINHFEAKAGSEEKLFAFLADVIKKIIQADGCINCRLLKGAENPALLAIIEDWESIAHHQAAASIIPKEQLEQAVALFAKPPVGVYYSS
jgi:quinol monooxygenase YgiN